MPKVIRSEGFTIEAAMPGMLEPRDDNFYGTEALIRAAEFIHRP